MNREEVNWILQTINDVIDAKRFVLAQYECGRISLKVLADVARERGWINRRANRFFATATSHLTEYAATQASNAAA